MDKFPIRVLVVEDYEPWRRYFSTALQKQPELQAIGEVSDGLEAVQKAQELQPDLILLDIGLPSLNGLEVARRIRKVSRASKILFVSENRSRDIASIEHGRKRLCRQVGCRKRTFGCCRSTASR